MDLQDELILQPRSLSSKFKEVITPADNEYILDIENLIHLEEKTNYFNDIIKPDAANICIIGSVHLQNGIYCSFQDFTINNLSKRRKKYYYQLVKVIKNL